MKYEILFYEDKRGNSPVLEYLEELKTCDFKRLKKIQDYFQILENMGLKAGGPFIKKINKELWELRPKNDRVFFFGYDKNIFVLLHAFTKKTQKTPKREIKKAINEMEEYKERFIN